LYVFLPYLSGMQGTCALLCIHLWAIRLHHIFRIISLTSRFSEKLTEQKTDTWIFSTDFRDIPKYQISRKSVQWEPSCSMRTDKRTYRHDGANSRFSQFCESA